MRPEVYVSGALTGVENPLVVKALYEGIGSLCEEMGLQAYVPHLSTDPLHNPDVTPRQVFEIDRDKVSTSALIIAYVGSPSIGVGMELACGETNDIPIILLYERGGRVSRLIRGLPSVIAEIQFNEREDALIQLENILHQWQRSNDGIQHRIRVASTTSV